MLPTDTADDALVGQSIRNDSAIERDHHRRINKSCLRALCAFAGEIIIQRVDETNARHLDGISCVIIESVQALIEGWRANEESRVQQHGPRRIGPGCYPAFKHARVHQV